MKRILCTIALVASTSAISAQEAQQTERVEFNPHWFISVQAGAAYTLGEAKFGDLISPAAALSFGYQFTPIWSLRAGISGWQSKGGWAASSDIYDYNYLQGSVDVRVDLANLLGKRKGVRAVNPYLFAGVGLNGAFNNDDAVALKAAGKDLRYLWSDSKCFAAGRFGVGADFRLSQHVAFNLEVNANTMSDHYNSKKAGNADWQFNALGGFTFRLGKTSKRVAAAVPAAAVAAAAAAAPAEQAAPQPAEEPQAPATAPAAEEKPAPVAEVRRDVFFTIGSAAIRSNEQTKIEELAAYMTAHPETKISVVGYADVQTGTRSVNLAISKRRAEAVAAALEKQGVAADRIRIECKGDTEQPFAVNAENRVTICIAR